MEDPETDTPPATPRLNPPSDPTAAPPRSRPEAAGLDHRLDRRTPAAVAGYYFFSLAGFALASPYLPLYWKSIGFTGASLGALLTAQGLGGLLAQAPMGYLSDRGGWRRGLIFGAMAFGGFAMFAYPLYRSFWVLMAVSLLWSAAFRSADALVQALVGDWAAGYRMASLYGRVRMLGSVGWVLSLLVSSRVAFLTNWHIVGGSRWAAPMFLVIGTCYLLAAGSILLARVRPPQERLHLGPIGALVAVARAPGLAWFLFAFALYWTGLQGIGTFLSLFLNQMRGGHAIISLAYMVSAISEIPFIFLAGRLADRWGERRLLMIAFSVMPFRALLYAFMPSPLWALAGQALHSITYGLMIVGSVAYVNHRLPATLRASGQGALGIVMSASSSVAPFVGAFVAQWYGYRGTYVAMAVISAAAWVLLRAQPREDTRPEDMEESCVAAS